MVDGQAARQQKKIPVQSSEIEPFFEKLLLRAATFDELLACEYEPLAAEKSATDLAAARLAAWSRSCSSGDWNAFALRLRRDGWTFAEVLSRFSSVRRRPGSGPPEWLRDAIWIEAAARAPFTAARERPSEQRWPFEELVIPVADRAEDVVWSEADGRIDVTSAARGCLKGILLSQLSELCAPALYESFSAARKSSISYDKYIAEMKAGGIRDLFERKPVLLRLLAVLTRQWISTSKQFLQRLASDAELISREILSLHSIPPVSRIELAGSDRHNGGQSVVFVTFAGGQGVIYKPKDQKIDAVWFELVASLNDKNSPIKLRAPKVIARDGYGWTEFIQHIGCSESKQFRTFFRRAGAWLALLHRFAAADMHQENIIAAGSDPVLIDLETLFHTSSDLDVQAEEGARAAAKSKLMNSVMMVGLLPAYGRSAFNRVFAMGGMTSGWNSKTLIGWNNINSDNMRPMKIEEQRHDSPNLPYVNGQYAKFSDHVTDFIGGFAEYSAFLNACTDGESLVAPFAGATVRKVSRSTRFYYMLQQRLRNHKSMDDGVSWSTQADFMARLAKWDVDVDPLWPMQRREREALLSLNIPHFVTHTDENEIRDTAGAVVSTAALSGMEIVRSRLKTYDSAELAWQIEVIEENTRFANVGTAARPFGDQRVPQRVALASAAERARAEADSIADELSRYAIRRKSTAAWIGFDWLEDAEAFQLACLGYDLYNGASGISLFLAAHATLTGSKSSGQLALAGVSELRKELHTARAAAMARTMGIGAATGLGSIIYVLTCLSKMLNDNALLSDAITAAELITSDLIRSDARMDLMSGSAGAIICLLRLYQASQSEYVLRRAMECGDHLLSRARAGDTGRRSWPIEGVGPKPLNGISHGAAGFAYSLASLSKATGMHRFDEAAAECIAYENASYDFCRKNWPDFRNRNELAWPVQWCHGALGIGLARLAILSLQVGDRDILIADASNAIECAANAWPGTVDTLCCGTLGTIEFLREAARALNRDELRNRASEYLIAVLQSADRNGDYRWNVGHRKFNLSMFRGLAGIGYSCLRQIDPALPNVLLWG